MSEENKSEAEVESVEDPTIKFSDDGEVYKVNDMPDEAKALLMRWNDKNKIKNDYTIKAQNDIDDLNRLMASYEVDMRNILEPAEEKKIEVSK